MAGVPRVAVIGGVFRRSGKADARPVWAGPNPPATGNLVRHTISIVLRDDTGAEKIRWNVKNAWPSKWSGPSLDAGSSDVAIESIELVHEGIEVQKW